MSPPGRSIPTAFYFIEQNTDTWCFCICCISPHPRGTLHPVVLLWAALRTSFHVVEGISLMMSHLYLNSSWSELLALLASSGECVLLAPTTCLLVCEVLPSSMCLGLIPGPVLTALLHRSWATSYIALHTLWALAAFSLQSWFQNQLQVRPLGPSLPAGSDMSSIMVLSTLPQCHAWERDHRTLHNIRTVTDDNEFLQTRTREGTTQTRARWTLVPLRTFHVQIREHVKRPTEAQRSAVTMTSNKRSASDVTK